MDTEDKVKIIVELGGMALMLGFYALTGSNKTLFDTKYGFNNAMIYGNDTAIVMDIDQWKDYSGEQIQVCTKDDFVLLTSSFDTSCFYGTSDKYNASILANNGTISDEVSYVGDWKSDTDFNYDVFDTNWDYNKSITFNGDNAVILPVKEWKDYQGEQLQVITPDGLVAVLCSTNSKLTYDALSKLKTTDFAQMYVGENGTVTDYSDNSDFGFNYDWIDTKYGFNRAVVIKDDTVTILPIEEWCDYEGEQLQLKLKNGPRIVTAAYDTIILNDVNSKIKATDIAKALVDDENNIIDYTVNEVYPEEGIRFNKTVWDIGNNGYSNAIISNSGSSTALRISEWCDYEGEQLQVVLPEGDIILTSSMMLDLVNGGNRNLNATVLSKNYVAEDGKNIDYSNGNTIDSYRNKPYLLDSHQKFNYALKVVDGNVTIIPINKWKDFYNSDGNKNKDDSPNCEQLQVVLPDGSALVTTAYDTALVNATATDIEEIAEMFRGKDGVITDLREYLGNPTYEDDGWNKSWFDTKYHFNYALLNNGKTSQVFPIVKWKDFSEGEQLQIKFNDETGILTTFVNTCLLDTQDEKLPEVLAKAFNGSKDELTESKTLIYK